MKRHCLRTAFVLTVFGLVVIGSLTACKSSSPADANNVRLSDSPLVGKFVWHDLISDDVDSARAFYGELLGWQFEKIVHPLGRDYTLISAGGRYIGGIVYLEDEGQADYSRWLPYLSVADVDKAVSRVQSAGGSAVVAPVDVGDIARAAAVTDPQGAVVGLVHSRVGDPDDSSLPRTGQVVWNELLAEDASEAAGFYESLAGLDAQTIERRGGQYTLMRSQGRDRSGIMQRPDDRVEPLWLTHFAVGNVLEATQRVEGLGGQVLLAPSSEFRDGMLALVTDPSGAVLALHEVPQ